MNARGVTQFVKAFGVFGCFDNEWQWHGEVALVRVGEETLRCSLPELFGRSVARRVAAAGLEGPGGPPAGDPEGSVLGR